MEEAKEHKSRKLPSQAQFHPTKHGQIHFAQLGFTGKLMSRARLAGREGIRRRRKLRSAASGESGARGRGTSVPDVRGSQCSAFEDFKLRADNSVNQLSRTQRRARKRQQIHA